MLRAIRDIDVKDKRVILRAGFDLNLKNGKIAENEDLRIKKTLPTIRYLLKKQAKLIIISHIGRPKNRQDSKYSLKPIATYLEKLLGQPIRFVGDCVGEEVKKEIGNMKSGEIVMLENLRFHSGEEKNDENFVKELAGLGDTFVNDAFSVAHREHASIVGIPKILPSAAGFLLEEEIKVLKNVLEEPKRPLIVIIGGAKISTKIKLIKKFLGFADHLLLGGALVNTVLQAKGIAIGKSLTEKEMIIEVKGLELTNSKLHIPVDVLVSEDKTGEAGSRIAPVGKMDEEEIILDIGPETNGLFSDIIEKGVMVIWNGPMGFAEIKVFSEGTREIARAVVDSGAYSIVGGGDTVSVIREMGFSEKVDYISTGGGAMLEFLTEGTLPGIEALNK